MFELQSKSQTASRLFLLLSSRSSQPCANAASPIARPFGDMIDIGAPFPQAASSKAPISRSPLCVEVAPGGHGIPLHQDTVNPTIGVASLRIMRRQSSYSLSPALLTCSPEQTSTAKAEPILHRSPTCDRAGHPMHPMHSPYLVDRLLPRHTTYSTSTFTRTVTYVENGATNT